MENRDKSAGSGASSASSGQILRQQAEEIVRRKAALTPEVLHDLSPDVLRQTLHELQVNQIELEMQNEELRRTQVELDASRARYFDLYDLAPVGYCTVSEQGLILEANITASHQLGVARSGLVGQPISRFIIKAHQDIYYLYRKQLFASSEPQSCELQLTKSDGTCIWVNLATTAAQDENGAPVSRIVLNDVTEHKIMAAAMQESEARYRALVEWSPEAIAVHRGGTIIYANPAALAMFGAKSAQEVVGTPLLDRVHPDFHAVVLARMKSAVEQNGATPMIEEVLLTLDGTPINAEVQSTATVYDGAPAIQVAVRDITARKQAARQILAGQQLLHESALHTQTILDNMADGVITINMQGLVESFNQAASSIFGYSPEEMLGRNVSLLMPEPHRSQHQGYLQHYQRTGEARVIGVPREVEGQRKDGSIFPISLSISRISRAGQPVFIGMVRDITQHRQDVEEIRRLAFYDSLTGLPNRRLMLDRLRQAILTSDRTGQHGALMFLDLDHFKQLNDTLGHDVGDELLQQVAMRLQACVREGDSVARMGGDEFVVLLEALSSHDHEAAAQTEVIAGKILNTLGQPYSLRGHAYTSTPSIGILVFIGHTEGMEDLLKKADVAMYQAKYAGRNTARFFDPAMQAAATAYGELEKDMRRGLSLQEFTLHYQIQVNGAGEPTGAEALVRWNHAVRGMVWPAHFIPLAEETGMILPLGQWVLETACAELVTWANRRETAQWTMAVNVSVSQFTQSDFVATVLGALQKTGANPRQLKLELTESILANDLDDVIANMNDLKSHGVLFALDDFGTGYSSLSRLKRLPLDQLKIDQSFVHSMLTDASDAAIARTVMALGHSLGLKVLAQGVETAGQRDFLASIGCDAFQGYFFGHPGPASALANISNKNTV